jgi:hypothetical protein
VSPSAPSLFLPGSSFPLPHHEPPWCGVMAWSGSVPRTCRSLALLWRLLL